MTTLTVDLSDPEMQEACGDCQKGESKTFTNVSAICTSNDGKTVKFDVEDLEYEGETPEEPPVDDIAPPAPTKSGRKLPPAVAKIAGKY